MTAAVTSIDTTVFGSPVRVLIGSQLADGMLPLSARLADREAYHRFLEFDPDTSIVRVDDQEEFRRFLNDCHGRHALPRRLLGHALVVRHHIVHGAFGAMATVFQSVSGDGLPGLIVTVAYSAIFLPVGLFGLVVGIPFQLAGWRAASSDTRRFDAETRGFLRFVAHSMHAFWNGPESEAQA
jgi:hypothetical protein